MTLEDITEHCFSNPVSTTTKTTTTTNTHTPAVLGSQLPGVPLSPPPPPPPPPPLSCAAAYTSPSRGSLTSLAGLVRRRSILLADEIARAASEKAIGEESRSQGISRHGLASSSITRHLLGFGPPPPSGTEPSLAPTAPATEAAASRVPIGALGKRPSAPDKPHTQPLGSPSKKPRLVAPGSISIPAVPRTAAQFTSTSPDLVSPLFFSNSNRPRMTRPPSFATSEIAASIMGDTDNPDGVTTLRLPKGVATASPARSSGTPGSWSSTELSSLSRSPDSWPQPSTIQLIQGIGVIELLEQDDRPTFIIDLNEPSNFGQGPLHIIFANAALRAAPGVLELLHLDTEETGQDAEFARFKAWAVTLARERASSEISAAPCVTYTGLNWTSSTVRRRFRVIRGNNMTPSNTPTPPRPAAQPPWQPELRASGPWTNREPPLLKERGDYFGPVSESHVRSHSEPRSRADSVADTVVLPLDDLALATPFTPQLQTTFDFTRIPPDDPSLGPHHRFVRSIDWASTSLGPVEMWPSDLRIMVNMVMGSPHPAALYWGPDYVAIYNEAYISLAGRKHPHLMGSRYRDAWPEIWDELAPVLDAAWKDGSATMKHDDGLFLTRHGFVEETFFNWAIIPLVGGDGTVVALYNPAFENTRRKIGERRMLTLREVGVKTSQARDVKGFWSQLQKGLEYNELDVPFALIYSVSEDSESDSSSMASGSPANLPQIILEGSIGVPDGHPCALSSLDLRSSDEGFAHYMRESMANAVVPVILSVEDGSLPQALIEGLHWRGFGDPCRTIVIFPVHPTTAGDTVVGFIVLGINPRRQYDDDYKLFVNLLSRQLATSMASVVLFDEEIKRGQRAARLAALDRQELSMQLHLRTQEAVKSEYRFTRMAEFGPVGLFIADGHGHINYCNEMWYKISGHERGTKTLDAWMQTIREEDRASVESIWSRLVEDKRPITHEFRFKGSKRLIDGHSVDIWTLMSAYPEKDEHGELKSIFGCLTDISQQKWAEDFQKQRRDEAVELKRQQENFIDITSHEMRNPLSAILQCADEISSGLHQYMQGGDADAKTAGGLRLLVESCVEAANTISLCASHQKRIVDDILTLSKLDSNLLLVTPVDVQPVMVVQNVLKMFETELSTNDIQGEFHVEQSYRDLDIDWVKLDPSRLRQVLINLMTNAIKFTQGRPSRSIVISLGASKEVEREGRLSYIPPRHPDQQDLTDNEDWSDGEKIHLHLAVTDTGPGLDDDEKKILFQRFSQASPRTHVQYGGSGLGLFICRILTELQGGQIGVLSEKGVGSTFAFYVKSRKSNHPQVDLSAAAPTPRPSPSRQLQSAAPPQMELKELQEKPDVQMEGMPPLDAPVLAPPLPIPQRTPKRTNCMDILIVEDNIVNQRVLQRQLQLSGNNTYVANHGVEALIQLRRSRFWNETSVLESSSQWLSPADIQSGESGDDDPDKNISVILMDLEMPVMDGMSCTREIRRLERNGIITRHIPIIAVTAYARPEQIENAKSAGVDDVISKPFRIPELIPKIEELVEKYDTKASS